jgi:hypothetical protein
MEWVFVWAATLLVIFFCSGACVNPTAGQYSAEMDEPSTELLLLKPMIE